MFSAEGRGLAESIALKSLMGSHIHMGIMGACISSVLIQVFSPSFWVLLLPLCPMERFLRMLLDHGLDVKVLRYLHRGLGVWYLW